MSTIEFAPKASVVVGRIATKSEIKAADNSKWDYDAIILEVRDSANKAHELRFIESFAEGFNFAADLFVGNVICADVEECIADTTQFVDVDDTVRFHTVTHNRVVAVRAATEDELVGFLTTVITKSEVATLNEVYASLGIVPEISSLIAAARNNATPLVIAAKDSVLAERKSFAEAYQKLHSTNKPTSAATKKEVIADRLAALKAKREALAKAGANAALLASYDRKIEALTTAPTTAE